MQNKVTSADKREPSVFLAIKLSTPVLHVIAVVASHELVCVVFRLAERLQMLNEHVYVR